MSARKGGKSRQFNGLLDICKKTLKSVGLYHGFNISRLGSSIVYCGIYFGLYDSLKPVLLTGALSNSFLASYLLGWSITMGAGLASYPLYTVHRHMKVVASGEAAAKYRNSAHAFAEIIKREGAKSLFKGAGAASLQGAFIGAGMLACYDQLHETLFSSEH